MTALDLLILGAGMLVAAGFVIAAAYGLVTAIDWLDERLYRCMLRRLNRR